jgi:hypothetical protein
MAGLIDDLQTALEGCGCGCTAGPCTCDSALPTPPKPVTLPKPSRINLDDADGTTGSVVPSTWWSEQTEAVKNLVTRVIAERSARHYPFKRKSKLGPGPRKSTLSKADQWDCSCNNYVCSCKGNEGQKKRVTIDRAYKAAYNREYRAFLARKNG